MATEPRPASGLGSEFPYTSSTICYIEVHEDGHVTHGRDADTDERAVRGTSRLFAVWPGQWRSDLFAVDDLDEYARAFGHVHDAERSGLADHEHAVRWSMSPYETKPRGSYVAIEVRLDCGCRIRDLGAFAKQMKDQRGWDLPTNSGWGSHGSDEDGWTYSVRARRKSLEP